MKTLTSTGAVALLLALGLIGGNPVVAIAGDSKPSHRDVRDAARRIMLPEFKLDGVTFMEGVRRIAAAGCQFAGKVTQSFAG